MRIAILLFAAAALAAGTAASAQDGAALSTRAADYLSRAAAQGTWPRLSAAYLSQASQSTADFPASDSTGANTPLVLGDAAAALTGLLLADLASSGRVRLDDPVSRFLPEGLECADPRVCALTLQQLATQTSGLPPLPTNLFPSGGANVWAGYRESDLMEFLANYHLPTDTQPRDSALGNVLLGWLLGRAHGGGYAAALAECITRPLGLVDTRPEDVAASALPTRIRSSIADLSQLLRAMLRPGESPLRAALMLSRQPRDPRASWGLGWRITTVREDEQEWPLVWQSAQTEGTAVFVGFRTDRQQAVAFGGTGDISLAPLGLALLKDVGLPPLPTVSVRLERDPAEYAGLYESVPGEQLLVRATSAGLSVQWNGRLALKLTPVGADLFAVDGAAVRLSFQRDARGMIDSLRWSENGVIVPVRRLSARAPTLARTEFSTSAEKKREYCGDYSVDNDVIARLHCNERMSLQFSGAQARELFVYADDRLSSRDGELELVVRRDTEGRVNAVTLIVLGNETTLPRTQWQQPAAALTALADERRERDRAAAAARDAAAAALSSPSKAVPWVDALPVLPPVPVLPYRAPGIGSAVPRAKVATEAAQATNLTPAPARNAHSPSVRAAPTPAPARVEVLPERFERPRFAPRAEEKAKEADK